MRSPPPEEPEPVEMDQNGEPPPEEPVLVVMGRMGEPPPPIEPAPVEMDQKREPLLPSAPSPGEEVAGGVYKDTAPFKELLDADEGEILCVIQVHPRGEPRS